MSNLSIADISKEMINFRRSFKSVVLGSLYPNGEACLSYAPILEHKGDLYIFVSEVAEHFQNMIQHPMIELFFLQDEEKAKILSARTRLKYKAKASLADHIPNKEEILDEFQKNIDTTIQITRSMADFHLFQISLDSGRFVKGFGQAFDISSTGDLSHIAAPPVNHKMHK